MIHRRTLTLTEELIRAYSRRGNFHSDAAEARRLGLPGLVAQGMQVAGPAYATLLDAWGETFLARGEIDFRFVGMVVDGQTVDATVTFDEGGDTATLEVANRGTGRTAAVGTASISRAARRRARSRPRRWLARAARRPRRR